MLRAARRRRPQLGARHFSVEAPSNWGTTTTPLATQRGADARRLLVWADMHARCANSTPPGRSPRPDDLDAAQARAAALPGGHAARRDEAARLLRVQGAALLTFARTTLQELGDAREAEREARAQWARAQTTLGIGSRSVTAAGLGAVRRPQLAAAATDVASAAAWAEAVREAVGGLAVVRRSTIDDPEARNGLFWEAPRGDAVDAASVAAAWRARVRCPEAAAALPWFYDDNGGGRPGSSVVPPGRLVAFYPGERETVLERGEGGAWSLCPSPMIV